jgi:tRNA(Ile)-lysidine synthase
VNHSAAPLAELALGLPEAPVCVGLSGGLDSVVLLHLLLRDARGRERGLRAVHVHHGVHPDADAWAQRCIEWCAQWDVPLNVRRVRGVLRGEGPEGALRDARYAAFEAELCAGEALVLAHHLDDQAETFLLRALRASGVDGLGAMAPRRMLGASPIVRPLLDVPRERLQAYASEHALSWIEDPGNADLSIDRNFLRHRVLPLLRERWPQAASSFARSAALCRQDGALLQAGDDRELAGARTLDPHVLRLDVLRALPAARRARVVRRWLGGLRLPPLPAHVLGGIETQLLDTRSDAQPQIRWSGAALRIWRDLLHADRVHPPLPRDWRARWNGRSALALPDGGHWQLLGGATLPDGCIAHARTGGERIHLPGRMHSHTLKHVLQDLGVPPWLRERLPLLSTSGGELLAAGDVAVSHSFDVWLRDHGARLQWSPPAGVD